MTRAHSPSRIPATGAQQPIYRRLPPSYRRSSVVRDSGWAWHKRGYRRACQCARRHTIHLPITTPLERRPPVRWSCSLHGAGCEGWPRAALGRTDLPAAVSANAWIRPRALRDSHVSRYSPPNELADERQMRKRMSFDLNVAVHPRCADDAVPRRDVQRLCELGTLLLKRIRFASVCLADQTEFRELTSGRRVAVPLASDLANL